MSRAKDADVRYGSKLELRASHGDASARPADAFGPNKLTVARAALLAMRSRAILLLTTSWVGIVPVNYTPGQLRDAIGIGQETYRHWKSALSPLRREAGHSPCFTAGDLLATAIVKLLVHEYSMRVGALSTIADGIFEECNSRSWPTLERSLIVLDITGGRVSIQSEGCGLALNGPAMVVPLGGLIESLRRTLLAGDGDGQGMLRFPPVSQPVNPLRQGTGQA
ncbi:hypothetical protein [Allosphingosinicella sp.]|jgi:hypothetical protein|uniref:hypothetical protein n=1 Tax=Allosphingosinicella sp. TaxID=2823234 RepID=UPI002EFF9D2C